MSNKFTKTSLILIALFLLGSFAYLSAKQYRQSDPNLNKDWWALYFEQPKGNNLDYIIENHSNSETFQIEIYLQKNKVSESQVTIPKGASKNFSLNANDIVDKKITISVKGNNQTREINKTIN